MASNKLFNLIHSMDKSEKRYFKLYAKNLGKEGSHVLALFEALARQKEYDEGKLKRKFRKETFAKQLGVTKIHLYDQLMDSLINYHRTKTVEDKILEGLRKVKILYKKQLFENVDSELKRLKQLTLKYDKCYYLPRVLDWELRLKNSIYGFSKKENLEEATDELKLSIEKLKRLTQRQCLLTSSNASIFLGEEVGEPSQQAPYKLDPNLDGLSSSITYHQTVTRYALFKRDTKRNLHAWLAIIDLFKEDKEKLNDAELFLKYINAVICAKDTYLALDGYSEIESLSNLQKKHGTKHEIPPRLQLVSLSIDLHVCYFLRRIQEGYKVIERVDNLLAKHPNLADHSIHSSLLFCRARIFFLDRQFDQANDYTDQAIDFCLKKKIYASAVTAAKILKILIFYEQDEGLLLPSLIRSCRRYLKQNKAHNDFAFELFFIQKIQLLTQSPDKEKRKLLLEKMQLRWEQDQSSSIEGYSKAPYLDYPAWIAQQLEKLN